MTAGDGRAVGSGAGPVAGDHLAAELRRRARLPRGEAVRLEFRAREADLFGFRFRATPG